MTTPPAADRPHTHSRRTLLAATAATALVGLPSAASAATTAPRPGPPYTVSSLRSTRPFYIAHRGGGRNWPAMTAYAYSQAVRVPGIKALEVSVCISDDGVLVCNHDATTTAATGVPYRIISETWATLSTLMVLPQYTIDRRQPARPFTRFEDVLERYLDDYVLFVEPKVQSALEPLMRRLARAGQPERVVWKQTVNSKRFVDAKRHGFTTWGYVLPEKAHVGENLKRYAASPHVDMLGAWDASSDGFMTDVARAAKANGKQTIAWEISTVEERRRVLDLGCVGLMTSNVVDVVNAPL